MALENVKDKQTGYYTYSDNVNLKKAGFLYVNVIAVDMNGDKSEKTINVEVKGKSEEAQANNQSQNTQKQNQQLPNDVSQPIYTPDSNNHVIVIESGH